jgi:hypothetical protein
MHRSSFMISMALFAAFLCAPISGTAARAAEHGISVQDHRKIELGLRSRHRARRGRLTKVRVEPRIGTVYPTTVPSGGIGPTRGMPGPQVYTPPSMLPTPQYYTTPGTMQYCATRFRSYDPTSNTRLDSHGIARSCF